MEQDSNTIIVKKLTTKTIVCSITKADDSEEDFEPTGYSLHFMVKNLLDDPDSKALISKIVNVDSENTATVILTPSDTNLDSGVYVYATRLHKDANNSYPHIVNLFIVEESGTELPTESGSGS